MPVRSLLTDTSGGVNGTSAAGTLETFTLTAAARVNDVVLTVTSDNTGVNTASAAPTPTTLVGPTDAAGGVLRCYTFGKTLTAADITGSTDVVTWTSSSKNLGLAVEYYGVTLTGAVVGTPAVGTTATSLTAPTVTTTVPGTEVYIFVLVHNAQTTPPTLVSFPAGYTSDKVSSSAHAAAPNYMVAAAHLTTPGAPGTYGGGTVTVGNVPAHSIVYTIALPPALAPATQGQRRARSAPTTRRGRVAVASLAQTPAPDRPRRTLSRGVKAARRRPLDVPTPQIPPASPLYVPTAARRGFKGWQPRRRTRVEVVPQQVAPTPPPFVPGVGRKVRAALVGRRRRPAELTPPQVLPAPPLNPARGRLRAGLTRRRRTADVVPPQTVTTPPPYVPSIGRRVRAGLLPRPRRRAEVVPPQVAATPPPPYVPAVGRRGLKGLGFTRRDRHIEVTPPQVVVTPPKYAPPSVRRGFKGLEGRRRIPAEVTPPQATPPPTGRRTGKPTPSRRRTPIRVAPPAQTTPPPRVDHVARRGVKGWPQRLRRQAAVIIAAVVPGVTVPDVELFAPAVTRTLTAATVTHATTAPNTTRTTTAMPTPRTLTAPAVTRTLTAP